MSINTKATFLTIERPLVPTPPLDSRPYFCLVNTLIFHDKEGKNVWEQEIPELEIAWVVGNHGDEFTRFFHAEAFKDSEFGWQIRITCSHEKAKAAIAELLAYIARHHADHFKLTGKPGLQRPDSGHSDFPSPPFSPRRSEP